MKADELLKQGRREEVWTKYCGFLDLDLAGFMDIQKRLLMEQVSFLKSSQCEISRRFTSFDPPFSAMSASVSSMKRSL